VDFLFCLYVFISLIVGGGLSLIISKIVNWKIDYLFSLSAGMIVGILCLEFIPHSFSHYRPISIITGIGVGLLCMMVMDQYVHRSSKGESKSTFFLLLIAITLHNAPSGFALGNHVDHEGHLYHLIILHHLPEGMALMMLAIALKLKPHHLVIAFLYLTFSLYGFVLLGNIVMIENDMILGALLGVAISTMLYISIIELFLTSIEKGNHLYHWLSLLTGIFIVEVFLLIG
jgi:zinc transporter, ZIP family